MKSLLVTIPHSGETIPPEAKWLKEIPEALLLCDLDRFVDQLYSDHLERLKIPWVKSKWHRYAGDLNRLATDVDLDTVEGANHAHGKFSRGFIWKITTRGDLLLKEPLSHEIYNELVQKYYKQFHLEVEGLYLKLSELGCEEIFHLDAHSMPSVGTTEHRDPGQKRADVVISDCDGSSCSKDFSNLVRTSFESQGFSISYNWPYKGGRITEQYGRPQIGRHAIQVELNRALYMNEESRQKNNRFEETKARIGLALESIHTQLP